MSYQEIAERIKDANAILIGASNGFSISEGLHLFARNQAFTEVFGEFQEKYGLHSIIEGIFYRFPTAEEHWAFFSHLVNHYSGSYTGSPVMDDLKAIIGDKPYFIVTSNGESHFELAGFDDNKVFEVEGNWMYMRCGAHCHKELYPMMDLCRQMDEEQKNCLVPSELIPRCPKCGAPMRMYDAEPPVREITAAWEQFLKTWHGKKLVILELGIGWRNQLIKAPLMRLAAAEPNATYITINLGEVYITDDIQEKSFGIDGDLREALSRIREAMA